VEAYEKQVEKKGMRGRALKLMKSYLLRRFIQVVIAGMKSSVKQIYSGVPQGAKWSSFLWDFDISEMGEVISGDATPFGYADDVSLWYEVNPNSDVNRVIQTINEDLAALKAWGDNNHTTFEKSKMEMVVVSRKRSPFCTDGIKFDGFQIPCRPHIKLVGYEIDSKLTWNDMIDRLAKKGRCRVAALRRVQPFLSSDNVKLIYSTFIRSILEYGSVAWMGAAKSHLAKLDRVQASAEKLGGFQIESLQSRREAAAVSYGLKMLSGECKGIINSFVPELYEPSECAVRHSRHTLAGIQVRSVVKSNSIRSYRRGFHGCLPSIWAKLPQSIVAQGRSREWNTIRSRCKKFLTHGVAPKAHPYQLNPNAKPFKMHVDSKPTNLHGVDSALRDAYLSRKRDGILII
jgi:hypothetical protein